MGEVLVDVERLTYGFDAIGRHEGQVVFLPYAAPGDRVAAEIVATKRGFLRARVTHVLTNGPDRVVPACPHFTVCGGCQWQHVGTAAQTAAKTAIVHEQLTRIGQQQAVEVAPTLTGARSWGYRGRITLVVEGRQLGFHRRGSHALVEVRSCDIAAPAVAAHLADARAWVQRLRAVPTRVAIAETAGGVVLVAETTADAGLPDYESTAALCGRVPTIRGAVLVGPSTRQVVGDPSVLVAVEPDCHLDVPADCFTQVNPSANQLLVSTVLHFAAAMPGQTILDGYCGAGNFTVPLARRGAQVVGVERSALAVEALRRNADRLHLDHVTAHHADTALQSRTYAPGTFTTILLDPPRTGAADAVAPIAALRAARVIYVSCDPSTLARDVAQFAQHGYRLGRVQPIDLFPQTYHVETVAELLLT